MFDVEHPSIPPPLYTEVDTFVAWPQIICHNMEDTNTRACQRFENGFLNAVDTFL